MENFNFSGIERLPNSGEVEQLFILMHGVGGSPANLMPLVNKLRGVYSSAAFLLPEGTYPFDGGSGRQWFSIKEVSEENRYTRVENALPALHDLIVAAQERFKLAQQNIVLGGFSQGAIMSLEYSVAHNDIVGSVLAFSGRFAKLPTKAPAFTKLHLFHGQEDNVMPVNHALAALERIEELHGHATLDIAPSVGHQLHSALIDRAIERLQAIH
ncbi:MAG: esterase [Methylophilaceae bacterium]|nr:esterase [Methyloradius sp.]